MIASYNEFQQRFEGIEAIDYYYALEVHREIATHNHLDHEPSQRLFALLMLLMSSYRHGHACMKLSEIAEQRYFHNDSSETPKAGIILPTHQELATLLASLNLDSSGIEYIAEYDRLYIRRLYLFEQEIVTFLQERIGITTEVDHAKLKSVLGQLFKQDNDIDWQKIAVLNSVLRQFSIISGGPGTGKTTTVAKLMLAEQMLSDKKLNIALLAPTGKASQRMSESIEQSLQLFQDPHSAQALAIDSQNYQNLALKGQTIHRFLGIRPQSTKLKYHHDNPAPYDVVIVDEASMLDLHLFIKLIRALDHHTKLILIGDINQLPSVEAGSLLSSLTEGANNHFSAEVSDIIDQVTGYQVPQGSQTDYTVILQRNYRSQCYINDLAHQVLAGKVDVNDYANHAHIRFVEAHKMDQQLQHYAERFQHIAKASNYHDALKALANFRILVANRNLEIGTKPLNQRIERILGHFTDRPYQGKPIMITKNNYALGLFNGDIGIVWPDQKGKLRAYFDTGESEKSYTLNMLPDYETVYAMTIHKTQGSEFDHVAILLPDELNQSLTKELLYTGITRAKSKIDIIAEPSVFEQVIQRKTHRQSGIGEMMKATMP